MGSQTVGHDWVTFTSLSKYRTETFFSIENKSGGVEGRHEREGMYIYLADSGLPRWLSGKESTCQCRRFVFNPWVRKIHGEKMTTLSSILPWGIPWKEEPGRLQSMGHRVRHNWATGHTCIADSSCCTAETNTTLYINYTSIKGGKG